MTVQSEARAVEGGAGVKSYVNEDRKSDSSNIYPNCGLDHLPSKLTSINRWIAWRAVERSDGKVDKVPLGKVNDPATWARYDEARARAPQNGGVGIVFNGDGLGGVDLDACRDLVTGVLTEWASAIVADFTSYTEVSPSGTGVKIFALGAPPKLPGNVIPMLGEPIQGKRPQVEAYVTGRYFTVTGDKLPSAPSEVRVAGEPWVRLIKRLEEASKSSGGMRPAAGRNDYLYKTGCSKRAKGLPEQAIRAALGETNAHADERMHPNFAAGPLDARELEQVVRSVMKQPVGFKLTDTGNGERLIERHGPDLLYCYPWKTWLVYDGKRFQSATKGEDVQRAKDTAAAIYEEAAAVAASNEDRAKVIARHAAASQQRHKLEAMLWAAQSELAVMPNDLDCNNNLLNLENGTLDLRTLSLREHRRRDRLTKLAPVALDGTAMCPIWRAFLNRVFDGDADLIAFMQRAIGYTLTGGVQEHVFFLLHGTGANGKTTLVKTVAAMLGDYARTVRVEALLASDRSRTGAPNEDVANLFGVRFASTSEPDDQFRLNEALVKALTGGDTISARRLHEQLFEFEPTHKIFLAANHKPEIRGIDEGIWRRVMFVPFGVTIPKEEQDTDLPEKLRAELPGILTWAVEGLRAYRDRGLDPPKKVLAATADYREEQDILADFLTAECEVGADLHAVTAELTRAYERFTGTEAVRPQTFAKLLKARGFKRDVKRIDGRPTRAWVGLRLLRPAPGIDDRDAPF